MEDKSVTGPSPREEGPAVYTDIYQAPAHFRTYKSAKLTLQQINDIVADAYANKIESGDSYIPDLGGARKRFADKHIILNGFWAERKGDN